MTTAFVSPLKTGFDKYIGRGEHACRELKIGPTGDNVGSDMHFKSHSFPNSFSKGTLTMVHGITCNDPINTTLPEADEGDTKRRRNGGTNSGDSSGKRT